MPTALIAALLLGTSSQSGQLQKAKQLFEQGRAEYQSGQFQRAIQAFLAADRIRPSPALVYNVAQAYEKLGDLGHAVEYYQDYLVRAPGADDRDAVAATIKNLQAKLSAEPAAPVVVLANPTTPAATAPPTPETTPTTPAPTAKSVEATSESSPAPAAPEAAVTEPAKPRHSHAVAITLGAIGVAAGVIAIAGLVQVVNYQSTQSSITSGTFKGSYPAATSQANNANTWGDLSIALGVVAVGCLTGAGFTW